MVTRSSATLVPVLRSLQQASSGVCSTSGLASLLPHIQLLSASSRWWLASCQLQPHQQQQQQQQQLAVRHIAAHARPEGSPADAPESSASHAAGPVAAGSSWPGSLKTGSGSSNDSRRRRRTRVPLQVVPDAAAGGVGSWEPPSAAAAMSAGVIDAAQRCTSAAVHAMTAPQQPGSAAAAAEPDAALKSASVKPEPLDPFDFGTVDSAGSSSSSSSRSSSRSSSSFPNNTSPSSNSSSSSVAGTGGSSSGSQARPRRRSRQQQAAGAPPESAAGGGALPQQQQQQRQQPTRHMEVSGDGEVWFPEGSLLALITAHWHKLQACPSAAPFTANTSFDDFGHRYIQQLEREERARSTTMDDLASALGGQQQDSSSSSRRSSSSSTAGRGSVARLLSFWQPLLTQAIAEEQACVGQPARVSAAAAAAAGGASIVGVTRRDRPQYGPYLLLLEPQDLAAITLSTVLSRVATAVPPSEDEDATAWTSSSAGVVDATNYSSSSGPGTAASMAKLGAAVPAMQLAESVGKAVNGRLKYLRFKAQQYDQHSDSRAALRELRRAQEKLPVPAWGDDSSSSSSSVTPGDALMQELQAYTAAAQQHAARYHAGQTRIASLAQESNLPAATRRATAAAMAGVRWDTEVRLKVGAALLALLLENSHLPDGFSGNKRRPAAAVAPPAAAAAASSSGSSSPTAAAGFEYTYVKNGHRQQAFVAASSALVKVLLADKSNSLAGTLLVRVPPMVMPPVPWASFNIGGQLTSRHWMMRTRFSTAMQKELRDGMRDRAYDKVLDALNVLGNTAWRINPQVYNTISKLWAQKSTAGGLPSQIPLKAPPPPPTGYRLIFEGGALTARGGAWSRAERRSHVLAHDDTRRLNRNMASLKADFLLKKRVAEEYLDVPEFYYPHTLDFRGRAYPLHPNMHHLGDDTCRGLLMFAHGRPLGPEGLGWLQVHLANVWGNGQDKLSFEDRRAFAASHHGTILKVAQHPLRHTWWQQAEKPWQALAACCEIAGALQSGNPSTYMSHLPVHMDGSCNGLQHYAALGRDEAGGKAVNLLPSDKPQDVYKGVAEIVTRRAAEAAAAGDAVARRCVGLIDRKVVKQTVMTSVYGVTAIGARAQVEARLREKRADMKARASLATAEQQQQQQGGSSSSSSGGEPLWPLAAAGALGEGSSGDSSSSSSSSGPPLLLPGRDPHSWMDDKDLIWQASKYLADTTLDAIGEMFVSARAIMGWLADCARVVSAADAPVRWSSPLGLPIIQPYHKLPTIAVATATQHFSVVKPSGDGSEVEGGSSKGLWIKARQRSAFPPNYIHSIDSTHMMMTALECSQQGIVFAGVHDSFWTHAGSVPLMNVVLRDKFVLLHNNTPGLLEQLVEQLQAKHPGLEIPPIPERGHLALQKVKHSKYFFS